MAKHNGSKIPAKVQAQRDEAERIAKEQAERLFAPSEPTPPAAAPATEAPSLEQRLLDIDRRAKQRATDEKAALAGDYLKEARAKLTKAIYNTTDAALKQAHEEVQRLERFAGPDAQVSSGNGDDTKTRVRRSADDLRTDAIKLVDWLKAHPGSKGSAAQEGAGVVVKPPLNVRTFIEKYGPGGVKVTTTGEKAGTTYSVK